MALAGEQFLPTIFKAFVPKELSTNGFHVAGGSNLTLPQ